MSIAKRPSKITLPSENNGWDNLLEFLVEQFPLIKKNIWQSRFKQNKIHWLSGEFVDATTPFKPSQILCYYREVEQEPLIPFEHEVLFQDEHILVADKPHFLPVTPGGQYVNECLLERIRKQQKLPELVPLHRLDRETAGLVLFSVNPETRGLYSQLFATKKISKSYQAVALLTEEMIKQSIPQQWKISNRLAKSKPSFIMCEVEGEINAQSTIKLIDINDGLGKFELDPITGKTHQLRLHMTKIGAPILNDKFYPKLLAKKPLTFNSPLQLLAKKLYFIDPISGSRRQFESQRLLESW